MRLFSALERFFERVFERPSARLFHARLQPIRLQRRLERAMESARLTAADRVMVPNRYHVRLAPGDLKAFGNFVESLEAELADAALKFARARRYALADRPEVRLRADPRVSVGDVHVDVLFSDGGPRAEPGPAAGDRQRPGIRAVARPRDMPEPVPGKGATGGPPAVIRANDQEGSLPAIQPFRAPAVPRSATGAPPVGTAQTMIFAVPVMPAPLATLREMAPDGSQRELMLDGGPVTIGRATDNMLVLRDSRVSRHHGRLAARQGALVYRDLGSTNGSRVNGVDVDEVVLGAGDRIEVGDTVLLIESVGSA